MSDEETTKEEQRPWQERLTPQELEQIQTQAAADAYQRYAEERRTAIYQAMSVLMSKVQNIPMTGQMDPKAGGYRFRGIDDMIRDVGAACREVDVMLQSSVMDTEYTENKIGERLWTSCRLTMQYRFTSLEDGSVLVFEAVGEGRDNADKASAKAMSMALKYALGQALLIGTDDPDPDSQRPEVHGAQQEQARPAAEPSAERSAAAPAGDKAGRARQALTAAQNAKTRGVIGAIHAQAAGEGLLDEVIAGSSLADRLDAIRATLPEA